MSREPDNSTAVHRPSTVLFVDIWGHRLRVVVSEAEGERLGSVLLINGIGTRAEVLNPMVDAIDPRYEVIRFDPPGIGPSTTYGFGYTIPQMAWTVAEILKYLDRPQVDIVGYSWGGLVAQQIALQSPSRVRRMVLLSANTGGVSIPGDPLVMMTMSVPLAAAFSQESDLLIGQMFGGEARRHPQVVREMLSEDAKSPGTGYFLQLCAAASWTTLWGLWLIRQPTIVIGGDADPIVPQSMARVLAAGIPRARRYLYRGGHMDPLLKPQIVSPVINSFLNEA